MKPHISTFIINDFATMAKRQRTPTKFARQSMKPAQYCSKLVSTATLIGKVNLRPEHLNELEKNPFWHLTIKGIHARPTYLIEHDLLFIDSCTVLGDLGSIEKYHKKIFSYKMRRKNGHF